VSSLAAYVFNGKPKLRVLQSIQRSKKLATARSKAGHNTITYHNDYSCVLTILYGRTSEVAPNR
jgi:hypothetical protein